MKRKAGSVSSSAYSSNVESATAALPPSAADAATDSIGGAVGVAAQLPAGAGDTLTLAASGAFTDALGVALLIGSGVLLVAAVFVKRYLPDTRRSAEQPVTRAVEAAGTAS